MKTFLFLSFTILFSTVFSQTWTQKQNLPGFSRFGAVGFSLHGKGYIGLGDSGDSLLSDIWEYDPATNSWLQKSDFIGSSRRVSFVFSTDSFAFVGGGWSGNISYYDFFQYDPVSDTWTPKTNYPGGGGRNCFSGSVNGKGYVGGGAEDKNQPYESDFWEYDPSTDNWLSKAALPFGPRVAGVTFGIGDIVYAGMGHDGSQDYNDFWAYNTTNNTWNQIASFPGDGRLQATGFVRNGKAIVGGGYRLNINTELADYYEYDPAAGTWTPVDSFANGARSVSASFTIGEAGYLTTGWEGNDEELNDLWEYADVKSSVDRSLGNTFKVKLYPVPNNGLLEIQCDKKGRNARFELFNNLGQLVFSEKIPEVDNHVTIRLEKLPSATYYYRFQIGNDLASGKLLILR